jgi:DNA-binding CsgD family transcriptional regulator
MTALTPCADRTTLSGALPAEPGGHPVKKLAALPGWGPVQPLTVPVIAECAEAVIEALDAPAAAAPAILDGLAAARSGAAEAPPSESREAAVPLVVRVGRGRNARPLIEGGLVAGADMSERRTISIEEYAKAVLYNGLGHYQAARVAAQRACEHDDFVLLEGALAELVEASARSGNRGRAVAALRMLEARAKVSGSDWAIGIAACSRALLSDDEWAEASYLEAIERLGGSGARVALGRGQLMYGEWLRRQGRRIDAREQLSRAHHIFNEVGLGGFAERARRELRATGETVRKRTEDTRLDLTPQEAQIAQLAGRGCTNPEIGEQLFISPRTVEWHLGKVFTKLAVSSRRELNDIFLSAQPEPSGQTPIFHMSRNEGTT